jgi:hypothetical protein
VEPLWAIVRNGSVGQGLGIDGCFTLGLLMFIKEYQHTFSDSFDEEAKL